MSSPAERPPEEATEEQAALPSTVRSDGAPSPAPTDRYLDFEIEIANGEARSYPLTVTSSPAGEARETMLFPFDDLALESRLKSLRLALLRSGGPRRDVLSPEEDDVRSFGRSLFDALLVGRIHRLYETSYQRARDAGARLPPLGVHLRPRSGRVRQPLA
jgi:hypothetical protein